MRNQLTGLCGDLVDALKERNWAETRYFLWSLWDECTNPVRQVWYGLAKLWYWLPIIWNDRNWDQYYILRIWEHKFRAVALHEEKYGHHISSDRDAKRLRVCATLCKRLAEESYPIGVPIDFWRTVPDNKRLAFYKFGDAQKQADLDYLCKLVGKHLFTWWD